MQRIDYGTTNSIPRLTNDAKYAVLNGMGIGYFRAGSIADTITERFERHLVAQILAHYIFDTGAAIINQTIESNSSGEKYLLDKHTCSETLSVSELKDPTLIEFYHSIPQSIIESGSTKGRNTLQTFFIFKTALDNLPVAGIYQIYKILEENYGLMTYGSGHIKFPNDSIPLSDHVLFEFIHNYIRLNPEVFVSLVEKNKPIYDHENLNYCYCLFGAVKDKDQLESILANALKRQEPSKTIEYSNMKDITAITNWTKLTLCGPKPNERIQEIAQEQQTPEKTPMVYDIDEDGIVDTKTDREENTFYITDLPERYPVMANKYDQLTDHLQNPLKKAQIILEDYTKYDSTLMRVISFHWGRHHVKEVNAIVNHLKENKYADINNLLSSLNKIANKNPEGTLVSIIAYLERNCRTADLKIESNKKLGQ